MGYGTTIMNHWLFKNSRFNEENDSDIPISLEDVKTSFLLTSHEYTSFPGRKASMRVGSTVQSVISAGHHRIDEPDYCTMSLMSEAEMEERRFTW